MAGVRLQLEGRPGGLQRDLPRVHHPSGVQQVRRVQGGWAKAQGKHSNIGYDAPDDIAETKSKIRLGTGDPRISTAEMQVYTMEETNTSTTETLVNAAKRLVDELPEGTLPTRCSSTGCPRRAATTKPAA